jgi:hypothetical protein
VDEQYFPVVLAVPVEEHAGRLLHIGSLAIAASQDQTQR